MNWTNLKAAIATAIKTNNNQEITGALLQNTLNSIVNSVGANATFAGIATYDTSPGTPDGPVFWIGGPGEYLNFGSPVIFVHDGELGIFTWSDSAWQKYIINFGFLKYVSELVELSEIATISGKFYHPTTQSFVNNSNYSVKKYQVEGGKVYAFSGMLSQTSTPYFVSWFDSSDNFISNEPYKGSMLSDVKYEDQIIYAPSGASYALLNVFNSYSNLSNFKQANLINIVDIQNQIKYISNLEIMPTISITDNSFIQYNGTHGSNNYYQEWKYQIEGGKIYAFSGKRAVNGTAIFVAWLDSANNFISWTDAGSATEEVVIIDKLVKAPNNASYAILNVLKYYPDIYAFKEPTNAISSNSLKENSNKQLLEIEGYLFSQPLQPNYIVENSFFYYGGDIRSNTYWNLYKYAVTPGKTYSFSGMRDSDANVPFVAWVDNNNNLISYVGADEYSRYGGAEFENKAIIAPANAAYAWLNVQKSYTKAHNFSVVVKKPHGIMATKGVLDSCDLNDITTTGTWLLIDSKTYQNAPAITGFLRVSVLHTSLSLDRSWVLQEFYALLEPKLFRRKFRIDWPVENWLEVSGGQNITNNYTFNEYSQTVELEASPVITTDTNNYLPSSGQENDRTADILSLLQSTGSCHLGPGIFYIDSLIMPDETAIIGSGPSTKVYLFEGNNKFAIKLGKKCLVKDLQLIGYGYDISVDQYIGTRHGILWQGDYTQSQSAQNLPQYGMVENLIISNFSGGGITCYDTSGYTDKFVSVVNCHIINCCVGINISYLSEFNKFTNVRCRSCYYGCINNGGNNMFVNCDFSTCSGIAFLMDNSQDQSPNNSHGSCIGCVFNHTASNTGIGIKILNCQHGFIFDGCQIFFSQIHIENSKGIIVSSCNFGVNNCDISVDGGNVVLFSNSTFQGTPIIEVNNNQYVHFINCYNRNTGAIISN